MDPSTTVLAAAAATGPNTLQSQALTALRSALAPIIAQPTMAPTAFAQPLSMPTMPMASPLADPTPGALHLPTLQAIHRMQQQASPALALVPTIPQLPTTQPTATMPRDAMEYTQTNFPALTPRQLAVLAQLEMQDQQALRSSAHNVLQPSLQTMAGRPTQSLGPGHTQLASTTTRLLEAGQDTQLRPSSEPQAAPRRERQTRRLPSQDRSRSHTRPQRRRHRRSRSHRRDRRSRSHGARRAHRHRPRTPKSRSPNRRSRDRAFVLRSRSQLGKLPVPDLRLTEEWMIKWSYRAPPPQPTGVREGASQSSRPPMEMRAPSASYMDLTQETAAAPPQPPSRFRPSKNTVDLSNTTNPPPPQVMVKPAVMSFTVTEAAQLTRALSEMGSGSGIPDATFSELAGILLSSGRRDQAIDISSEVMSIADGVHQILFIPWAGRERTTFGAEEGETGSHYEYTWAHGASPSGLLGILSEDLVRPSAQDLKIEGTEQVQATAVYRSATPGAWSSYSLQTVLAQAIRRPKAYSHGMVVCGTILSKHQHYKCDFRDTRKEHAIVARRRSQNPRKVGIPRRPSHH